MWASRWCSHCWGRLFSCGEASNSILPRETHQLRAPDTSYRHKAGMAAHHRRSRVTQVWQNTTDMAEHRRYGRTPQMWQNTTDMAEQHRTPQMWRNTRCGRIPQTWQNSMESEARGLGPMGWWEGGEGGGRGVVQNYRLTRHKLTETHARRLSVCVAAIACSPMHAHAKSTYIGITGGDITFAPGM